MLRDLPRVTDPNLLVGTDHFDDAGVYKIDDETALVLTLDFFPPLVDDPYDYGRIAAANSLSDVFAMGGRPITALNVVGFPDDKLPIELLGEILRGGAERVAAAGAVLAGGHSVRDTEIKYGLSVTGIVHPDRVVTNGGAKPGDVLVLTKPIGTGVLTSAAKAGRIAQRDLAEAVNVMAELNAGAGEAMRDVGVHGATDITGFGLIGHAHEMADAAGVTIELDAESVPLLTDTVPLARKKMLTRAWKSNLEHLGDGFKAGDTDEILVKVLADAQTSGGLLICVAPSRADAMVEACRKHGTPAAAIVGRVTPRSDTTVALAPS